MTQITLIRDLKAYLSPKQVERLIAVATNPRDVLLIRIPWLRSITEIGDPAISKHRNLHPDVLRHSFEFSLSASRAQRLSPWKPNLIRRSSKSNAA